MSLAQILADHSRDITASITHTNEMAQDNAERKANDLEEKFQHAKDTIEGLGGEIAGFGGAWHLGRKIYNKYKARQSQFNQDRESNAQDNTPEADKAQGGEPKPDPDDKPGTAPKQGEDDPIETEDTFFPGEGGSAEADAIFGGAKAPTPPSQQVIDKPDVPLSRQQRALQPDAESAPDPVQGGDADARVADTETQPLGDLQRNVEVEEADAPQPMPGMEGREGTPLQESKDAPHQPAQDGSTPEATTQGDDQAVPKGGDEVDGVNLDSGAHSGSGVGGAVDQEAGDLGESGGKGLADLGDTIARKVGTKVASAGGDAISAGLDAASTVLDFLGPIGEGIGLITSLIGLFEGLGHKKKEQEETGQEAEAGSGTATAGIDTQALQKEELQNVPVGTAV